MAFSQDEIEIIKKMKQEGRSPQQIAGHIGAVRLGRQSSYSLEQEAKESPKNKSNIFDTLGARADQRSLSERVGSDITSAGSAVNEAITGTGVYKGQSSVRRGFDATAQAFNTIPKVATQMLPKPARGAVDYAGEKIGAGFKALVDKIASTDTFKGASGNLVKQSDGTVDFVPNDMGLLEDALSVSSSSGQIAGNILFADQASKVLQKGTDLVKKGADASERFSKELAQSRKNTTTKSKVSQTDKTLEQAIKDSTPDYESLSPKQKQKYLSQVKEGGTFDGRTVQPDKMQIEAGTELAKVKGYNPSATKLEKYQLVDDAVTQKAVELEKAIDLEKVVVPKREITSIVKKTLADVADDSLLLQKSDPAIQNYLRVYNNAIKTVSGDLGGVFRVRKILDAAYKKAKGANAFSDKIGALDEVNTAVRDALTQYVIKNAKNTAVQSSMKAQWDLYRVLDQLKVAAAKESGSSFGRLKQRFPLTNKIIEKTAGGVGLGTGIQLLD
jgi:hypothetical protein